MSSDRIKVGIVGCGRIGAQWDATSPRSAHGPLTHAGAFSRHARAILAAVCDDDPSKAAAAARQWGAARSFTRVRDMLNEVSFDVLVIATPSSVRGAIVEPALRAGVKVLVIEKPLATSLSECRALAQAIEATDVKTLVNYSRRWDPNMQELRTGIRAGDLGPVQRLIGLYGKGLVNNGSHMIDLAGFLCDATPLRARALQSPLQAGENEWSFGGDPAWDAQIVYADSSGREIHLTLLGLDQRAYTCFELRVMGWRGLCDISRGGRTVTISSAEPDPHFEGYRIPGTPRSYSTGAMQALHYMADEAVRLALGELRASRCDVRAALDTACIIDAVQQSAAEDGAWKGIAEAERRAPRYA